MLQTLKSYSKSLLLIFVVNLVLCSECYANAETELHQNVNEYEKKFISTSEYRNNFNGPERTMNVLGWYNFTGEKGFKQSNQRAIFWFEKAKKFGFPLATYNLGLFYYAGLAGFEQSFEKAHSHFLLAYEQRFIEDKFMFGIASEQELFDEMNKYYPNPSEEFANLRDLFIMALELPSNQRYERLKNLANLAEVKDEKITVDDFLNSEKKEAFCAGDTEERKLKIYVSGVSGENDFMLRAIMPGLEEFLTQDEFKLSVHYAKKNNDQIEWFDFSENDLFGDKLYHFKFYSDKNSKQLRLFLQAYDIIDNAKFYIETLNKYKILKKEKLLDIGKAKHIELEMDFYAHLNANYQKLKKSTHEGSIVNYNMICEL